MCLRHCTLYCRCAHGMIWAQQVSMQWKFLQGLSRSQHGKIMYGGRGGGGGLMYGGSRLVSRSHFLRWERCTHGGSWNRGVSASFYQLLVNWLVRGRAPESLQNYATTSRSPPFPFFLMGHCMDFLLQGDRMGASVPLIGSPMCPHHLVWSGGEEGRLYF